jgi:3-oxoacyl-[acyl-carrier-protein] synthase III
VNELGHARRQGAAGVRIVAIETHVPDKVLTNADLAQVYDDWTSQKILEKTGIAERRIAAEGETALDLGEIAARKLIEKHGSDIDFLIFCSQAHDYVLPSSACILQNRLGLPSSVGALDITLGCSGFVYGLSLAAGLISMGSARRVLLVTADTYSKYIHPKDKSVRTLFGDGAAATLVEADEMTGAQIGPFVFGTDGDGAASLIVEAGGFRMPLSTETSIETVDASGNVRSSENLFMDGAAVLNFSLRVVPQTMRTLLTRVGWTVDVIDYVVLHQANKFMLDALQRKMGLSNEQTPRGYRDVGNTVSSTIPFVLASLLGERGIQPGAKLVLIGFGVGLSWAGVAITA